MPKIEKNCKKKANFEFAVTFQNAMWPPFFISYSERAWVVDSISCIILGHRMLWRHHIAIWSKKIDFWFFTLHLTMFFWLYLGCFESIFSQISTCCSWECYLQATWHLFFHLHDGIKVKFLIKGEKSESATCTCDVYGGWLFCLSHKIEKCSKWLHFEFTIRFRPFWAFQKFPRVRVRARVFSRIARTELWNTVFSHVLGS